MTNKPNSISVRAVCGGIVGFLWANVGFFMFSGLVWWMYYEDADKAILRIGLSIIILGISGILFALINLLPPTSEEMAERLSATRGQTGTKQTGIDDETEPDWEARYRLTK